MPRIVDAEKLLKTIMELESWNVPDFVYESINNAPTVDAVRHGHWIKANDPMSSPFDTMKRCLCSECREWGRVTSYCPNCGAKMDEEEEDAEIH